MRNQTEGILATMEQAVGIYLDNAATTLHKPQAVIDAVTEALGCLGNCARGSYGSALKSARTVYDARCAVAELVGCARPEQVVFTSNATEALNTAIFGLFSSGDHVITTDLEHNSVLRPLYRLQEQNGVDVSVVPADRLGRVRYEDFSALLRPNTRAIVCTHASNLTGNVLDIARIGKIAHQHGALLVVDASQTAGCYRLHMDQLGVDVLCFAGHKGLMAPQGIGVLCVREGIAIRPLKVGGTGVQSFLRTQPTQMPTCLEAGTLNGHGIAGLAAAVEYVRSVGGPEALHRREIALARRFYEGVSGLDGVTVYGDFSSWERAPIVTLNLCDYDSGKVADALAEEFGIATRSGAHCAPRMHEALGTTAQGAVRFSFSWFNTEQEADSAIAAVRSLAE